jgi:hypothetical protein
MTLSRNMNRIFLNVSQMLFRRHLAVVVLLRSAQYRTFYPYVVDPLFSEPTIGIHDQLLTSLLVEGAIGYKKHFHRYSF